MGSSLHGGMQKDKDGDEQASTSKSATQAHVAECLVAAWKHAGLSSMSAYGPGIAHALLSALSPGTSLVSQSRRQKGCFNVQQYMLIIVKAQWRLLMACPEVPVLAAPQSGTILSTS